MNRYRLRAFLVASAFLVATPAVGAAAPVVAAVVGASPKIVAQLRAVATNPELHTRVAVPTFVPSGYRLAKVETPKPQRMGDVYSVLYRKDARSFFEIDCTSGGIGSVDDAHERDVHTALFAKPIQLYFGDGDPGLAKVSPGDTHRVAKRLISEWIGGGPFYHVIAENMTPDDVAHVLRSLAWLR